MIRTAILFSLSLFVLSAPAISAREAYSFGVVPQFDTRQIKQIWEPVLNKISTQSGVKLTLKSSPDIPAFEKQFENGEFDFVYMNPYHAIVANHKRGYQPILRDLNERLVCILVVQKDSPLKDVKQLDGKIVALPAPNALAALLLRAEFATKFHINPEIRYVRSHDSVYLNTAMGLADAGVGVLETLQHQPAEVREQLRIFYKTGETPKHPIAVNPKVSASVIKRVQTAFLSLGTNPEGKALLDKIPIKNIGKTNLKDYQVLIDMGLEAFYVKKE